MDSLRISANRFLQAHGSLGHWLLLSCILSIILLLGRVVATGFITYAFLVWNLFLAWIPYRITSLLAQNPSWISCWWKRWLSLGLWLVFVPNAFYILTDLFHLDNITGAPEWYDLLLIFSFAWNGLLFGIISLRRVERILASMYSPRFAMLAIWVLMWLNALGVYIGRYLRYNSWDLLTNPLGLAREILMMIIHPFAHSSAWGMTLCYAVFMGIFYITIKKIHEPHPVVQ